jgi:hypothetical protein
MNTQHRWVMNQLSRLQVMNPLSRKNPKSPLFGVVAGVSLVLIPASLGGAAANAGSHSATASALTDSAVHDFAPAAPEVKAKPVSIEKLEPTGIYGDQSHVDLSNEQLQNARTIVNVVQQRKMPAYAAVISVATALQESNLKDLDVAVDYDSLGLFQQRPSCGWGAPDQLIDPKYATNAFLDAMQKAVPDYEHTPLWQSAQATQQSAFPTRYAQWQDQAAHIVQQIINGK